VRSAKGRAHCEFAPHVLFFPIREKQISISIQTVRRGINKGRLYAEVKSMAIETKIEGNKLIIICDLEKPTPSASGKTLVVASTRGNMKTSLTVNGKLLTIGLNAYIPK
jgi:hypothetical protein